jgi:hypothetical protein
MGNIKDKVAEAPGRFWEFLKSVASAVVTGLTNFWHFITEKSLKSCIKKLNKTSLELTYPVKAHLNDNLQLVLSTTDSFVNTLNKICESDGDYVGIDSSSFSKNTKILGYDSEVVNMSAEDLLAMFEKLVESEVPKRIKTAIKEFKQFIKECDKASKRHSQEYEDAKKGKKAHKRNKAMNAETMKNCKAKGTAIIKAYSQLIRDFRTVANHVLKDERALQSAYTKHAKATGKANKARTKALTKLQQSRDDYDDNLNGYKTHGQRPNKNNPKNDVPAKFHYNDPYDDIIRDENQED